MMARGHVLTGVLAVTSTAAFYKLGLTDLAVFASTVPGAALLPDIDHAKATVSQTFGPVTRVFGKVLGHRTLTHSILGVLGTGGLAHAAITYRAGGTGPWIEWACRAYLAVLMILVLAAFVRTWRTVPFGIGAWFRRKWVDDVLPIPVAVLTVLYVPSDALRVFPVAVMIGMIVHILGDMITKMGVPIFWPLSPAKFRLARIKAGGRTERWIITPALIAGIVWTAGMVAVPWIMGIWEGVVRWW